MKRRKFIKNTGLGAVLTGVFVVYCHNLEHEDDGMMLQYQLT